MILKSVESVVYMYRDIQHYPKFCNPVTLQENLVFSFFFFNSIILCHVWHHAPLPHICTTTEDQIIVYSGYSRQLGELFQPLIVTAIELL